MEERKGFLTPEQEKLLDDLYKGSGLKERLDGPAIKLTDNIILEKIEAKIPQEYHQVIYEIVDRILNALKDE